MGNCCRLVPTDQELVHKHYLAPESSFHARLICTRKMLRQSSSEWPPPLDMWVARGMPQECPPFPELSRAMVAHSWLYLGACRVQELGATTFLALFAAVPAARQRFLQHFLSLHPSSEAKTSSHQPQHGMENEAVRAHGDGLVRLLDKVISGGLLLQGTQRGEALQLCFRELGDRHAAISVRVEYLDLFLPFFVAALRRVLANPEAEELVQSWADFARYLVHIMKESVLL